MSGMASALSELKRRKVYRVAVAYAAGAFVIWQAAEFVLPALALPDWSVNVVVVLTLLGFPLALAAAWIFEIRDGRIRAERPDPQEEVATGGGGWGAAALTVTSTLAVAALGWLALRPTIAAIRTADDPISMAVLPVDPLTSGVEDVAFADGLHEELLNQLARFGAFELKSRTSVLRYRGRPKPIREIAEELGAEAIVEATVRRAGETFRITIQLIDGPADRHLWSESFDWTYTPEAILRIQTDVARNAAAALRAELSGEEELRLTETPSVDAHAYEQYLAGLGFFAKRTIARAQNRLAIERFERAVGMDPEFAAAHAYLAQAWLLHAWFYRPQSDWREWDQLEAVATATAHTDRAFDLAPDAFETHMAGATLAYYGYRRFDEALEHLAAARRVRPGDPYVREIAAYVRTRQGDLDAAIAGLEELVSANPRDAAVLVQLGFRYLYHRRYAEALEAFERALIFEPGSQLAHTRRFGLMLWELGGPDAAEALVPDGERYLGEQTATGWRVQIAMARGDYPLAGALAASGQRHNQAATNFWAMGDAGRASAHADSALMTLEPQAELESARYRSQAMGNSSGNAGIMYAIKGDRERALYWANRSVSLIPPELGPGEHAVNRGRRARALGVLGDTMALADLEYLLSVPNNSGHPIRMRLSPYFRPLHDQPRFWEIVGCPERDC